MAKPEERRELSETERRAEIRKRVEETWKLDPLVKITLPGIKKEMTLEFDNAAMKGIFLESGINLLDGSWGKELTHPVNLGLMLYWGLKRHQTISQEDVDKAYGARHIAYIQTKLGEALQPFYPDISDLEPKPKLEVVPGKVADPTKKPPPSGLNTGQSGEDSDFLMTSSGGPA
jgi:hypothetical protein